VIAIDERTAWDLVRAVEPGAATPGRAFRVHAAADERVWIEVEADGSWRASQEASDAARDVFDIYLPVRVAPELVLGQLGQSLDGRIATDTGASHFVTGRKDIERLHRLRALVDAVVVGASTVAQDDPMLTVRLVEGSSPVRVVLDPTGRLDAGHKIFTERTARTLVAVRAGGHGGGAGASRSELQIPWSEADGFDLAALVRRLRALGLARILVEGGGVTVSSFLEAGLLDRLHITVAPMLIGSGRPSITLDSIASLDQALRPSCRRFILGEDVLFDLDLRAARA
jgi:riboflavin-specific deaminase-like protein